MGLLEHDADDVLSKLGGWKPLAYAAEGEYEGALHEFLNKEFPKEVFYQQYTQAKTRADLFVAFQNGAKVAIELKAHVTDRNEYHRLLGQLWTYVHE